LLEQYNYIGLPREKGIHGEKILPLIEMYFGKGALTAEQKADLSRKITDLVVKEAKQPQHYTWVIVHEVPEDNWMVGGLTLPELKAMLREKKG
jgi:4-oxalocrotonate tautomerase family enzyme